MNGLGKEQAGWEGAGGREPLAGMHTFGMLWFSAVSTVDRLACSYLEVLLQ